jgi:DNA-directed RNA polymerase subunit K/omega
MLSINLDEHNEHGIYCACILAFKRAQDLSRGAISHVEKLEGEKVTTLALREVLAGMVEMESVEETENTDEVSNKK